MQYSELDRRIIEAIARRASPLYDRFVNKEAAKIAIATGREDFRVIDARLQSLRRAQKIRHLTKSESNGQAGWRLVLVAQSE